MAKIAGHNFEGGPLGNLCINIKKDTDGNEHPCGRSLVDILGATRDDVSKYGFSCDGSYLSVAEYEEIEAEKNRIWGTLKHPG